MTNRALCAIALFISALCLPAWFTLLLAAVFSFLFPSYLELIAAGFVLDLLYAAPSDRLRGAVVVYTVIAGALYLIGRFVRVRLLR